MSCLQEQTKRSQIKILVESGSTKPQNKIGLFQFEFNTKLKCEKTYGKYIFILLTDISIHKHKYKNIDHVKKFRFCGDGDCPDWILAEIISTLSALDSKKFMDLSSIVAKKIIGEQFEEAGVRSITSTLEDDGKSAVACINYLLISAARHSTDGSVFNEELQQLGLPKDHAAAMCRVLSDYSAPIRRKLMGLSLKINELGSVKFNKPENTIDCVQLELEVLQELNGAGLPKDVIHKVNIDSCNVRALLKDMKEARETIREYDFEGKYYKNNIC